MNMAFDAHRNDLTVGIVGVGIMGRGVAQIAAQAGIRTLLYDARPGAALDAKKSIHDTLKRLAEKNKISHDDVTATLERLHVLDALEELAPCHMVLEAIVENLDVKRQLFAALEAAVGEECLLATNTSSLSVTEIAAGCRLPGRVGGYHFFNPVPLMKIVEVIDGLLTEGWVGDALVALAHRMGHQPVRAKDTPGFIVNHAGRGYVTESLRLLGEGIAEVPEVDRILRETESVCDRVGVIVKGQLKCVKQVEDITIGGITGYEIRYLKDGSSASCAEVISENDLSAKLIALKSTGCTLLLVEPVRKSLEEFFVDIVHQS